MTSPAGADAAGADAVLRRLRELAVAQLGVDPATARPDALLVEDLGVDSLALTELAMALEDEFAVELPDDRLSEVQTVADLQALVRAQAG